MGHVVLLGDSIFDNARYVPGGPAVIEHLNKCLPPGWRGTLLALDGATAEDVAPQFGRLPAGATHLVVSVGGNDALGQSHLVRDQTPATVAAVLAELGAARAAFEQDYRGMLGRVRAAGLPTVVCTVYDAVPGLGPAERAGLGLFNDVIVAEAVRAGVPVVDLRRVCPEASDYAPSSPIEPSVSGGGKIARAVARVVTGHDFGAGGCRVYT